MQLLHAVATVVTKKGLGARFGHVKVISDVQFVPRRNANAFAWYHYTSAFNTECSVVELAVHRTLTTPEVARSKLAHLQ